MKLISEHIALIGFDKDKLSLEQNYDFIKKNKYLAINYSWLINEDFIEACKKNLPFNLYINTGAKKIEYIYKIIDFVTLRGSKGQPCPEAWLKFNRNADSSQGYIPNAKMPIKTWFLVENIIKTNSLNYKWDELLDIRGIKARDSGKNYFLYIVDPLKQ